MDNSTNNKMIRYQKRKDDTVVIVSGGKTWYTYLGELPLIEDGITLNNVIERLSKKDMKQQKEIDSLKKQVSTLNKTVSRLIEIMKSEKESDKL